MRGNGFFDATQGVDWGRAAGIIRQGRAAAYDSRRGEGKGALFVGFSPPGEDDDAIAKFH